MMKSSAVRPVKRMVRSAVRRIGHWKNSVFDRSQKLVVAVYHRVLPAAAPDSLGTVISENTFIRQIDIIARKYSILPLREAVNIADRMEACPKPILALTFDDGYKDSNDTVFPILKRKGIPATFFIPADYIGRDEPLWDVEALYRICRCPNISSFKVADDVIGKHLFESRISFAIRVIDRMKGLNAEAVRATMCLLRQMSGRLKYEASCDLCMRWEDVLNLSRCDGIEIGSHGASHSSLARLPFNEAILDISRSKDMIEEKTGKACESFAFPFGSARDFSNELLGYLKSSGFKICALNIHGYNSFNSGLFAVKRVIMDEFTDPDRLLG